MTWEVGTKAARRINPAPSKTSRVRPRRPIARLHAMLAHIDPSEEVTSAVKQGEDRDRTDEGGKRSLPKISAPQTQEPSDPFKKLWNLD